MRQDVRGEQASTREARQSLRAFCRAQRRERKEQILTRGEQRGVAAAWLLDAIRPCLAMKIEAAFNRRMRKTARSVVWEGAGAQSPELDPIPFTLPSSCY